MLKRLLDILGAALGIVLLSPLLLICAIAVRRSGPGPVFFRQDRIGKDGQTFQMLKYRSMVQNAEKIGTGLYSFADDPRITRAGHVLRKYSLDELPQLFNVLGGSMSLVGPRPPVVYELGDYADFTPDMKIRFQVKPGITGLAQVSGRNDLDWDEKIIHDNRYVELLRRRGIWLDLWIILRTFVVIFGARGVVEAEPDSATTARQGEPETVAQRAAQTLADRK